MSRTVIYNNVKYTQTSEDGIKLDPCSQELHSNPQTYSIASLPPTNFRRATSEQNISPGNRYLHGLFNDMYMGALTTAEPWVPREQSDGSNRLHRVYSSRSCNMSSSCDPPRVSQMTSMSAQQSPSASERKIAYEDDIVASSQLILAYLDNEKQSRLLQPYTSGEQPTHMRDLQSHGSVNPIDKNLGANQQQFLWPSTETGNTESDVGNRYQIPAVIGNGHSQLSNLQENAVSSSQSWNGAPYAGPGTFLHDQQPQPHTTQQGCNYPVARQSLPQMYRSAFSPPSGHRQSNSPVTTLSTPMYSSIDLSKPPKRHRRRKSILNLQFHCEVPGCERKYASKLSRKQHYLLKHPSEKFDTK